LADFGSMDAGFPVYAAAGGKVISVADGNFDRNTVATNPPANFVIIDHGSGWQTEYYHFATNTITVKLNDVVKAGQLLGLVGSSGNSTGPHLHFGVHHNGAMVEMEYDPADYWISPLPYQGSQPTTILDAGVTNFIPTSAEYAERPADESVFSTGVPKDVTF